MPDGEGEVRLGPIDIPDFLRPIYANYVNVNHTPWDFRMTFAVVKSPAPGAELETAQREGVLRATAVADVIIPANLMVGLMTALRTNWEAYVRLYGVPGMDPSGPQIPGPTE